MFDLANVGDMHWYVLFVILSLESSSPYLKDIGFPLRRRAAPLIQLARNFLRHYHLLEDRAHYDFVERDSVTDLFDQTYELLVQTLGERSAQQLCQWGNRLNFEDELSRGMLWIVRSITPAEIRQWQSNGLGPLCLPESTQAWLLSAYKEYSDLSIAWYDLDEIVKREITETNWGQEVLVLYTDYNDGFADGLYRELRSQIRLCLTRCFLRAVDEHLNPEEMAIFEAWLKTDSLWLEDQASETPSYYSPAEVFALIKQFDGTSLDQMCFG